MESLRDVRFISYVKKQKASRDELGVSNLHVLRLNENSRRKCQRSAESLWNKIASKDKKWETIDLGQL